MSKGTIMREVNRAKLWHHVETLSALDDRASGSEGESLAVDYIVKELAADGISVKEYRFPAYLSYPGPAGVDAGAGRAGAITHPFSAATGSDGLAARAVYLGANLAAPATGSVRGHIAIFDGAADSLLVHAASAAGAVGAVFISGDDVLHEVNVSPVWGTPTPETAADIPPIPVVSVGRTLGEALVERGTGASIRIWAEPVRSIHQLRLPVAEIPGRRDFFVLVGTHLDAWNGGVTDNATGDAMALELARLFADHRDLLEYGLRLAWWPGHVNGKYAGSTWYVDNVWAELRAGAIAYVNIDSPGAKGATSYRPVASAELEGVALEAVHLFEGKSEAVLRAGRNADQSFRGLGLPSLAIYSVSPSKKTVLRGVTGGVGTASVTVVAAQAPDGEGAGTTKGGARPNSGRTTGDEGGDPWWWHNPTDTLDKADTDLLQRDTQLYAAALSDLCRLGPQALDLENLAAEVLAVLGQYQEMGQGGLFNLGESLRAAGDFRLATADLKDALSLSPENDGAKYLRGLDGLVLAATRAVNPVLYTAGGAYVQDAALPAPLLPGLSGIADLADLPEGSPEILFARTALKRQKNRLVDALTDATELVKEATHLVASRAAEEGEPFPRAFGRRGAPELTTRPGGPAPIDLGLQGPSHE